MSVAPNKKCILLIGPLPPPPGGATLLFEQLLKNLGRTVIVDHIDTNSARLKSGAVLGAAKVTLEIVKRREKVNFISFHASIRAALLFGPVVALLAKTCGIPWSLRVFGGEIDRLLNECGFLRRWLFHHLAKSPAIIFVERKSTVQVLNNLKGVNGVWLPNSRPMVHDSFRGRNQSRREGDAVRFVFIGHVKPSKGVYEIVKAARLLGERNFSVDIYGPLLEGVKEAELTEGKCRYQRELRPDEVISTMQDYDVLLLPSYWRGEGYPGVIIEAFGCGLAVIASDWGGIPEIVSQDEGILVLARNDASLAEAMASLLNDGQKLKRLREGARKAAEEFSAEIWSERFLEAHENWVKENEKKRA